MGNLNQTLRKFNRFELKYLITRKQAAQFKSDLSQFIIPDEHGNNNGVYQLVSLYYDSPDLRCYWKKWMALNFAVNYVSGYMLTMK